MAIELQDKLYTSAQVADVLGVSLRTLYRYMEDGRIKSMRTASGRHRFTKDHIVEFLNAGKYDPEIRSDLSGSHFAGAFSGDQGSSNAPVQQKKDTDGYGAGGRPIGGQDLGQVSQPSTGFGSQLPPQQYSQDFSRGSTGADDFSFYKKPAAQPVQDSYPVETSQNVYGRHEGVSPVTQSEADYQRLPNQQTKRPGWDSGATVDDSEDDGYFEFGLSEKPTESVKNEPVNQGVSSDFSNRQNSSSWNPGVTGNSFASNSRETQRMPHSDNSVAQPPRAFPSYAQPIEQTPNVVPNDLGVRFYKSEYSDLIELARKIKDVSIGKDLEYAFTLYAGLSLHFLINPFTILHFYVNPEDIQIWKNELRLSPGKDSSDSNLGVLINTDVVFMPTREIGGFRVVDDKLLLRDLMKIKDEDLVKRFRQHLTSL